MLVTPEGEIYPLRNQSLKVIRLLAKHSDTIVSKTTLHEHVWPDVVVTDDSLVQCISELRKALGDKSRTLLRTFPRQGYLLSKEAFFDGIDHSVALHATNAGGLPVRKVFERVPGLGLASALVCSVLIIGVISSFSAGRVALDAETQHPTAHYEQRPFTYQNSKLNKVSTEIRDRKLRKSPHGAGPWVNASSGKEVALDLDNIENRYRLLSSRTYPDEGMPYWNSRFLWDGYYPEDR